MTSRTSNGLAPSPDDLPDPGDTMVLARRARQGDTDALNDLLRRHERWLHRVVRIKWRPILVRRLEPDDIVNQAMEVARRKIREVDPDSATGFRRWLARIAENQLRDAVRVTTSAKRNPSMEVPLAAPSPSAPTAYEDMDLPSGATGPHTRAWKRELKEILDDAVRRLPEHYQQVVLLHDYEKQDWETIRQELGKETIGMVKQYYQRAWEKIREIAAPKLDGAEG